MARTQSNHRDLNPESGDTGGVLKVRSHSACLLTSCTHPDRSPHCPPSRAPSVLNDSIHTYTHTPQGDWWTPEAEKLAVYDSVQPHPSWLNKVS